MIYLLHFSRPVSGKLHYLGVTTEAGFDRRMQQHATGNGANLTRRAVIAGVEIYIARVFPALNYDQERRMKNASHFKNYCPMCCPMLAPLDPTPWKLNTRPPTQPPKFAIWDWRTPTKSVQNPK